MDPVSAMTDIISRQAFKVSVRAIVVDKDGNVTNIPTCLFYTIRNMGTEAVQLDKQRILRGWSSLSTADINTAQPGDEVTYDSPSGLYVYTPQIDVQFLGDGSGVRRLVIEYGTRARDPINL